MKIKFQMLFLMVEVVLVKKRLLKILLNKIYKTEEEKEKIFANCRLYTIKWY